MGAMASALWAQSGWLWLAVERARRLQTCLGQVVDCSDSPRKRDLRDGSLDRKERSSAKVYAVKIKHQGQVR